MGSATSAVAVAARGRRFRRDEREFLPAALEIVETPPSPIGRLGAYCLIALFALVVVWAWLAQVDIVAIAKGKIIPTGYTKVVQPFETGVVRAIRVRDGQKVSAGDILVELDPTMNQADLSHLQTDMMAAKIDVARLTAALNREGDPRTDFAAPAGASPEQAAMGEQFFLGQVSQYRSRLAAFVAEEAQKRAERESLKASIEKIRALLPLLDERMQMRKTLFEHQNGSRTAYLEILQDLVSNQKELDVLTSRLKEADAALVAAESKREEAQADYRRGIMSDRAEAIRKASGLEQDIAKAEQRTKYQALTAPIDGTVQQLAIHTIGGVVTPAQTLLAIVPSDSTMEIEAMVDNQDIGFVHAGQDVEIKVDTFNFTRYGLRHGTVVSLSQDAIVQDHPAKSDVPKQQTPSDSQGQQSSYAARVSLDRIDMQVGDKTLPLSPGMAVTVEIKTGTRRVINYLLSPLLRHAEESLRER